MSDAPDDEAKPVSMSKSSRSDRSAKAPASAPAAAVPQPREVRLAIGALMLAGVAGLISSLTLFGERGWLTQEQVKANDKSLKNSYNDAHDKAVKAKESAAAALAAANKAKAKTQKDLPSVSHQVSQAQTGALIGTALVVLVLAFLCYGLYRGRHWSRWGVSGFWVLASFTGTSVGVSALLTVGNSSPAAYKIPSFIASLALIVAVVLVNMKSSTSYFALSRPKPAEGAPARRGLFAPRTAPPSARRGGTGGRTATGGAGALPKKALTSNAATRGEAYVERQRSKKRAAANAESIARGAELARTRAKASKSRRIET